MIAVDKQPKTRFSLEKIKKKYEHVYVDWRK